MREVKTDDPERQIALLLDAYQPKTGEPSADDGQSRLHQFIAGWKSSDFEAVVKELSLLQQMERPPEERGLLMALLTVWSELDPQAASLSLEGVPVQIQPEASRIVAATWYRNDPQAALAWARNRTAESKGAALAGIGAQQALTDPRSAILLAQEAGMGPECELVLQQAATTWAGTDPEDAVAWGRQIVDPDLRDRVLSQVAIAWADEDPVSASFLVKDAINDGLLQENAFFGIVQRMALQDMGSARDWVAQFPDSGLRERAKQELDRINERMSRVWDRR